MKLFNNLSIALTAGFIAGLANVIAVSGFQLEQGSFQFNPNFVYKQAFWGGLWALLYCVPTPKLHWVFKGVIISIMASFCTFAVFQSIPFNLTTAFRSFVVNILVWGGISAFLYHKFHIPSENKTLCTKE